MGTSKETTKYILEIKKSALREIADLPAQVSHRMSNVIDKLVENPLPKGVQKLKGMESTYRIRIGDYRVVYRILLKEKRILVVKDKTPKRGISLKLLHPQRTTCWANESLSYAYSPRMYLLSSIISVF